MAESVEYTGTDYTGLANWLNKHFGDTITFDNGCVLHLDLGDDLMLGFDDLICGTEPYGTDWFTDKDEGWEEYVISWLRYWDQPRTEIGDLMCHS